MTPVHRRATLLAPALLCLFCLARPAAALPAVQLGTDYMKTLLGSFFDFPSLGPVQFMGHPPDPGMPGVDTIVKRMDDAMFAGDGSVRIETELVQLSLMSVAPIQMNDSFFDVFVDVSRNMPSQGFMDLTLLQPPGATQAGRGTYDSFFDIWVDVELLPAVTPTPGGVGGSVVDPGNRILMPDVHIGPMTAHGDWSSAPPPGTLLVPGGVGDPNANWHPRRDPDLMDFFPLGEIVHTNEGGTHRGTLAVVPEPGSLAILGLGLVGMVRRRRTRA